ncbi:MAG: hypothetical protein IJF15_03365 [Oscillospiraceae bacterium]|nr:hypothetical protein [Oscillospiraceae bacterium]
MQWQQKVASRRLSSARIWKFMDVNDFPGCFLENLPDMRSPFVNLYKSFQKDTGIFWLAPTKFSLLFSGSMVYNSLEKGWSCGRM